MKTVFIFIFMRLRKLKNRWLIYRPPGRKGLNQNPVSTFNFPSSKDSRWKSRRAWNEYFMMVFETDYWFWSMQLISWKHPCRITTQGKLHLPDTHMTTIWPWSPWKSFYLKWTIQLVDISLNAIKALNYGRCFRGTTMLNNKPI